MDARETMEFWRKRSEDIGPNDFRLEMAKILRDISIEMFGHRDANRLDAKTANIYAGTLKAAAKLLEHNRLLEVA